ncbi:MAG: 2-polyprenyl-3-methyl-6-methoxy-1,4-benzoquinone monooxygenase [Gammaproteobacteria bacterium]|nr:2-polyprenyl-3-methyl-6-methoxy-1,4-benzoquinone monooxygenase [Gammaproteobacteria bacterium]
MSQRRHSTLDHFLNILDTGLRSLAGHNHAARPTPAAQQTDEPLSFQEQQLSGRLMRINHAGEIAAQGLYQGQALTAALPLVREQMQQAAQEEIDHLAWCANRTQELETHTSFLDPFWYIGSVVIGATAGRIGDKWSLGFVAETERQVVKHLNEHLTKLPGKDAKSRAILEQMKIDEQNHATLATKSGGVALPTPIRHAMTLASKIMTKTAFWL